MYQTRRIKVKPNNQVDLLAYESGRVYSKTIRLV